MYGTRGAPGLSPAQLAVVTALQFAENLTGRQVADAVRGRIDWKYCLGLELADPGFDFSMLSEFRAGWWPADGEAAAGVAATPSGGGWPGRAGDAAADGFHARAGPGPGAEPAGAGRGGGAGGAGGAGRRRAGLAGVGHGPVLAAGLRVNLDYPVFLAAGWPVASGLIEGAARWLIKDRHAAGRTNQLMACRPARTGAGRHS